MIQPASRLGLFGKRRLWIGVGFGLLIAGVSFKLLAPADQSPSRSEDSPAIAQTGEAIAVTLVATELTTIQEGFKATGTVIATELLPVTAQATGLQIQTILVDEGQSVRGGQVLARLNSSLLQAQLVQAQGSVAQAEARVAELRSGSRLEELNRAQEGVRIATAGVTQAQSDLELVQKRVQRNQTLEAEGAIARDRLDEILNQARIEEANLQQAKARLAEAQSQLTQLRQGPRPEVITQAEAQLQQAQGQVQFITAQLQQTQVIAPASGTIATRTARIGAMSNASEPLFTIIQGGQLELELMIPETQLPQVRPGQVVRITAENNPDLTFNGQVRTINPVVNDQSRQATVNVILPANGMLKPGMFLQGEIITRNTQGITIPTAALLPQTEAQAVVFVLEGDNRVRRQTVVVGELLGGDRVEIVEGLNPGDRIVLEGAPYLKDGAKVSIES